MKILLLFLVLTTCFKPVGAREISLSLSQCGQANGDNAYNTGDCEEGTIAWKFDNSNFYIGYGRGDRGITMSAYEVWRYKSKKYFVGLEPRITKNISVYGQVGYVDISNNIDTTGRAAEGIEYGLNLTFGGDNYKFEKATLENSNAFSFEAGANIFGNVTKNLKLGFRFGYEILKIREVLRVKFVRNNEWIWVCVQQIRDLSGWKGGAYAAWEF